MHYALPLIGSFDLEGPDGSVEIQSHHAGRDVQIDLTAPGGNIAPEAMAAFERYLGDLAATDATNRKDIAADFENGGEAESYVAEHLEEILDQSALAEVLVGEDQNIPQDRQLLASLFLSRIGLYPESPEGALVFDYRVSAEHSDELLVVRRNLDGSLLGISTES